MKEIEVIEQNERQRKEATKSNRRVNGVAAFIWMIFEFIGQAFAG